MRYTNGRDALPPDLLAEVQKYLCGGLLYIPMADEKKARWGQLSGYREQVSARNRLIADNYKQGSSINDLTSEFCLSEASIRKIIYTRIAEP